MRMEFQGLTLFRYHVTYTVDTYDAETGQDLGKEPRAKDINIAASNQALADAELHSNLNNKTTEVTLLGTHPITTLLLRALS